jgi:hypothetical protein
MRDAGRSHGELVARGRSEIRKAADHSFTERQQPALFVIDELEALVQRGKRRAVEPAPDGIDGFGGRGGPAGGDFLSLAFKKSQEFRPSDFEAAHPAGAVAALRGTSPLDAAAGDGDLSLIRDGREATDQAVVKFLRVLWFVPFHRRRSTERQCIESHLTSITKGCIEQLPVFRK